MNAPSSAPRRSALLRAFAFALALAAAATLAAQGGIPGLDAAGMDRSVRPGDDFYRYANGTWEWQTLIPADRGSVSGFAVTARRAEEQLTTLIRAAEAARAPVGSDLRRIGDFYTAFVDTAAIAARGMAPLRPLLARIEGIGDRTALARLIGETLRADVDVINEGDLFRSVPDQNGLRISRGVIGASGNCLFSF